MITQNHPRDALLSDFAVGALATWELDQVAGHLAACADCRARVDDVLARDGFLDRVRSASSPAGGILEDAEERRQAARALRHESLREKLLGATAAAGDESEVPREIGDYQILREVGRGGMGVVYQARHRDRRHLVALKMILAGQFATEPQLQRFQREAELAARVEHPNIVAILEVGSSEGRPFIVMEWVDGGTLADRIGTDPWSSDAIARLIEILARAIEEAHRRGVVHRDLKPSNILLGAPGDGASRREAPLDGAIPKIADFGLARAIEEEGGLTGTGLTLGTPEYMAPEQATMAAVGPPADIYALGVIAYQLLTGQPPFRGSVPMQVLHSVVFDEPIAPRRLRPGLSVELETITLKALEKEPARRYPSAGAMADDLRRVLEGRPIVARPTNAAGRLRKWSRRHPGLATLSGLLLAVTVVAFVGITAAWLVAVGARDEATRWGIAERRARIAERRARYRAELLAAANALELNHLDSLRTILETSPEEQRNWEWRYFSAQLEGTCAAFRPDDGAVGAFAMAPDGLRIAYAVAGGSEVRLRALGAVADLAVLRGGEGAVTAIAISPDGGSVAAGTAVGEARVWALDAGRPAAVLAGHRGRIDAVAFSADARRLMTASDDGTARVWDLGAVRPIATLPGASGRFDPAGRRAVTWVEGTPRLWDVDTGREVAALARGDEPVRTAAFSPDGAWVATGGEFPEKRIRLWDAAGGRPLHDLAGHGNSVTWVAWSPDGSTLASASMDRTVRLWQAATGRRTAVLRGHRDEVGFAVFTPDGRRLLTTGGDRTIRVWDTSEGELLSILRAPSRLVGEPRLGRGGSVLACADAAGAVLSWDIEEVTRRAVLRGHDSFVYDVAIAGDGRRIASSAWDGTARIWDGDCGREAALLRHDGAVFCVAMSGDGRWAATMARPGLLRVWGLDPARVAWSLDLQRDSGPAARGEGRASFRPRGDLLAVGGFGDGSVRLFRAVTGEPAGVLDGRGAASIDVAFSPDGTRLASSDAGGRIRLWDVDARRPVAIDIDVGARQGEPCRLSYSSDGRMLASTSGDRAVRLWDAATGEPLATLPHDAPVYATAFSPDGTRLATACGDSVVHLWDLATHQEVAELRGHEGYVHAVAFSPDGTRLVSGSGDSTIRVWDSLSTSRRRQPGRP